MPQEEEPRRLSDFSEWTASAVQQNIFYSQ